jgi:hypothetical protein
MDAELRLRTRIEEMSILYDLVASHSTHNRNGRAGNPARRTKIAWTPETDPFLKVVVTVIRIKVNLNEGHNVFNG